MMELTAEDVQDTIAAMFVHCNMLRAIGGIAEEDRVNRTVSVPQGWVLDGFSDYWVPPNLIILKSE